MFHILIVDDERYQRILLCEILKIDLTITCVEAENGRQALDVARKERIDLVIMDVMMPIMDGLKACRAFKSDPSLQAIPILLLSAYLPLPNNVWKEAGADGLLHKPFQESDLHAEVRSFLAHDASQS